jgi:hypothetical protein
MPATILADPVPSWVYPWINYANCCRPHPGSSMVSGVYIFTATVTAGTWRHCQQRWITFWIRWIHLKGLQRSPRLVKDVRRGNKPGVLTASDVSCLVIPDGCIGLPTLAALEQGIPVIAVRENHNIMRNDLRALPWASGQLHIVENYWEAAGVMSALKQGVDPASVRRPLPDTIVVARTQPAPDSND